MGNERPERIALLRFSGEFTTKARATRLQFRRRLFENLRDALSNAGLEPQLEIHHTRIYVQLPESHAVPDPTDHPLARVYGIQSVSFGERYAVDTVDAVVEIGERIFRDRVRGKRFAVRARRVGDRVSPGLRRRPVEVELGTRLLTGSAGVDLSHPEVTVHIELSETGACFFSDVIQGPAGLPLGVEGRAVALVSGGFDSAVAAWQLQRRGVEMEFVFCNLGGPTHLAGTLRVIKCLADRWCYGTSPGFHVIDFEPVTEAIREHTTTRYWQLLLKRMMLRAAERIARLKTAAAIVTGDAVGQVSSQTLTNLAVVSRATDTPILRPLVALHKEEIIDLATHIGTFELSKVVAEYCAMVPSKPATRASREIVEAEEAKLPPDLLERVLETRTVFDLRSFDVERLDLDTPAVSKLPPGAVLIDLRPLAQYRTEHHPEALHLEFAQAVEAIPGLDRGRVYVFSCEFGLMSAHLAEQMRREGFEAFHFTGGQRALMQSVEAQPASR
jgi:thiamine biosynthesis protein ThiI